MSMCEEIPCEIRYLQPTLPFSIIGIYWHDESRMFLKTLDALQHCAQCALLPGEWAYWVHWLVCSLLSSFVQLARLKLKGITVGHLIIWPIESVSNEDSRPGIRKTGAFPGLWILVLQAESDQLAPQWLAFGTLCFLEKAPMLQTSIHHSSLIF